MAFSFFASKKPVEQKKLINGINVPAVIRTMQDDIEDVKYGGKVLAFAQSKPEEEQQPVSQNIPIEQSVNPFGKTAAQPPQKQAEDGEKKIANPFMGAPQPEKSLSEKPLSGQQPKDGLDQTTFGGTLLTNQPRKKSHLLVVGIAAVVATLLISGGAYYYLFVRGTGTAEPTLTDGTLDVSSKKAENPPVELPYALDQPNYLPIDTETVVPSDIQKSLSQAAVRIKEASITQPVEFLVRDQNNNPLAFSRFAFLSKIDLHPEILVLLDEAFSLYMYNDAGNMRLGLGVAIKNQPAALTTLTKIENTLPSAFQVLILEPGVAVPVSVNFKSNTYSPQTALLPPALPSEGDAVSDPSKQEVSLRYANIDVTQNLSIDYAVVNNHWYIGTSRGTLRALLDMNVK